LNYANVFGYQQALGLEGKQFNYLAAMVYAGYWFGTYPAGWLIGRYQAQRVMAGSCLVWGLMVIILTQARSFQSALAVRFFLGVFEAAVTPGLTLMTGFYYTRNEIPLRQCIWYSSESRRSRITLSQNDGNYSSSFLEVSQCSGLCSSTSSYPIRLRTLVSSHSENAWLLLNVWLVMTLASRIRPSIKTKS
jgi:hypothetical protein